MQKQLGYLIVLNYIRLIMHIVRFMYRGYYLDTETSLYYIKQKSAEFFG